LFSHHHPHEKKEKKGVLLLDNKAATHQGIYKDQAPPPGNFVVVLAIINTSNCGCDGSESMAGFVCTTTAANVVVILVTPFIPPPICVTQHLPPLGTGACPDLWGAWGRY
jgi:hypothetical protein